jgi:uncharacterized membrane protein
MRMKKNEFLQELGIEILGLPQEDTEHWLEYYTEMLEDRIEEGMSEQEATAALGDPKAIARQILAQTPFTKLIKNKIAPKRKLQVWEIVLVVLGSPIWLAIAVSLAAAFFAIFASLWAGIVSVWAAELSVAVCGLAGVLFSFFLVGTGTTYQGLLLLGGGLFCAGLAYFGFFACKCLTVLLCKLCKLFVLFVKSLFVEKEGK